jgi:hypothetical protein
VSATPQRRDLYGTTVKEQIARLAEMDRHMALPRFSLSSRDAFHVEYRQRYLLEASPSLQNDRPHPLRFLESTQIVTPLNPRTDLVELRFRGN